MNCLKCGTELAIKMSFLGTPVNQSRELYCPSCGTEHIGTPSKGELKLKDE